MGEEFHTIRAGADSAQPLPTACAAAEGLKAGWGPSLGWGSCPVGAGGPRIAPWGGRRRSCCGGQCWAVCGSNLPCSGHAAAGSHGTRHVPSTPRGAGSRRKVGDSRGEVPLCSVLLAQGLGCLSRRHLTAHPAALGRREPAGSLCPAPEPPLLAQPVSAGSARGQNWKGTSA